MTDKGEIVWLGREPEPKHHCSPPLDLYCPEYHVALPVGTVWRCGCGRRWKVVKALGRVEPLWVRRYLPTPRPR